jgi:hypothetical protein
MNKVAVYTFKVWNPKRDAQITMPRMGTPVAIRRSLGEADLESQQLVDESAIDAQGFYVVDTPTNAR